MSSLHRNSRRPVAAGASLVFALCATGCDGGCVEPGDALPDSGPPAGTSWEVSTLGGPALDYVQALAVRDDGSFALAGKFEGSLTFGVGETDETTIRPLGETDMFLAQFDSDGTLAWVVQAGNASAPDVAALDDGSWLVTGVFGDVPGASVFGPGEAGEVAVTRMGYPDDELVGDFFAARYRSDGTLEWLATASSYEGVRGTAIAAGPDGSFVAVGAFDGEATFGAGEANETVLERAGFRTIFIARYAADGSLIWARQATGGSAGDNGVAHDVVRLPDGAVLVVGNCASGTTLGTGEMNEVTFDTRGGFLARYDVDGSLDWARALGGSASDAASLSDGSLLVTGSFGVSSETVRFGIGEPNETELQTAGDADMYLSRHESDGALDWVVSAGGAGVDHGIALAATPDGSFLVTGSLDYGAVFGRGEEREVTYNAGGGFVARYDATGAFEGIAAAGERGHGVALQTEDVALLVGVFWDITARVGDVDDPIELENAGDADTFIARFHP